MPELEVIKPQPDFPNEDLANENVAFVDYFLKERTEARSYAQSLESTMRPLHLTAHYALELVGVNVAYTPEEYTAFCKGFASFEYMSLLVTRRHVAEQLFARNALMLLTGEAVIPEIDMATRRAAWIDLYPNVNDVVLKGSVVDGETMPQLYSRAMGAQIACELQMTA